MPQAHYAALSHNRRKGCKRHAELCHWCSHQQPTSTKSSPCKLGCNSPEMLCPQHTVEPNHMPSRNMMNHASEQASSTVLQSGKSVTGNPCVKLCTGWHASSSALAPVCKIPHTACIGCVLTSSKPVQHELMPLGRRMKNTGEHVPFQQAKRINAHYWQEVAVNTVTHKAE
jgi:hypothetical protein